MNTAKEMYIIAQTIRDKSEKRLIENNIDYIRNNIMPEIQKAAKCGAFSVDVRLEGRNIKIISSELTALGYKVRKYSNGTSIRVNWRIK